MKLTVPPGRGEPVSCAVSVALLPTVSGLLVVVRVKVDGSPIASTFTERVPDVDWL